MTRKMQPKSNTRFIKYILFLSWDYDINCSGFNVAKMVLTKSHAEAKARISVNIFDGEI